MSGWIIQNRWWVTHTAKQPGINWSYPTVLWPILLISLLLHAASCKFNVHDVCMFHISDKSLNTDQLIFHDSFPHIFMYMLWLPYVQYVHKEIRVFLRKYINKKRPPSIWLSLRSTHIWFENIHNQELEITATWLITVTPITSTVESHSSKQVCHTNLTVFNWKKYILTHCTKLRTQRFIHNPATSTNFCKL